MTLRFQSYPLKLKDEFRIAHGTRTQTDSVQLSVEDQGEIGYGEAVLPPYFGLTAKDVLRELEGFDSSLLKADDFDNSIPSISESNLSSPTKAALDMALHDLAGKIRNTPVHQMLGLNAGEIPATTYTIGHCSEEELIGKLKETEAFLLIKLKLGSDDDRTLVEHFRKHCSKPFMADPNQGWKDVDKAIELTQYLKEQGCLLLEQPMPIDLPEADQIRLKTESALPLFADESVTSINDLETAARYFHGVNVKLMKCGGIAPAHQLMKRAKEFGLRLMIGCMAESSVGVMAAAQLAPLAEICDLDGPFLQANNPFPDPELINGRIHLTNSPGIGVGTRQL